MSIFLLLIVLVLLAWLIFKPEGVSLPHQNEMTEKVSFQAGRLKEKSDGWLKKTKLSWKKKASLGVQLKLWALNEDLETVAVFSKSQKDTLVSFRGWIQSITDAEADALANELSAFCAKQDISIRWLLDDGGKGDMQGALSSLVLYYGMAIRERVNSRPASTLRAWQEAPLSKKNFEFGNHLYVLLADAGLISIPAHLLLASEKDRLGHLVEAVNSLIDKDREALLPFAAQALELIGMNKSGKSKLFKKKKEETSALAEQVA